MSSNLYNKSLLIVGAGGFGRSVYELALLTGDWENIHFVDDCFPKPSLDSSYPIVGKIGQIESLLPNYYAVVVAIGNNKVRSKLIHQLEQLSANLLTLIHPKAIVSQKADIGIGSLIMAGSIIGPHALVGKGCILNPNSVADHDSIMEDYSHLGVGAVIPGTACLKKGAWLRAGVSITYGDVVPEWTIVEPRKMF